MEYLSNLKESDLKMAELVASKCSPEAEMDEQSWNEMYSDKLEPLESFENKIEETSSDDALEDKELQEVVNNSQDISIEISNILSEFKIDRYKLEKLSSGKTRMIIDLSQSIKESNKADLPEISEGDEDNLKSEYQSTLKYKQIFSGSHSIKVRDIIQWDEFKLERRTKTVDEIIKHQMAKIKTERWVKLNLHKLISIF